MPPTNIGIRKEDMIIILILRDQELTDQIRAQIKAGEFSMTSENPSLRDPNLQRSIKSFYKISGELGTINYGHSVQDFIFSENYQENNHVAFLRNHGIN